MTGDTIKDRVAIVGLAETQYYKHGGAPVSEFQLTLEAIIKAAEDAGIAVTRHRWLRFVQQRPQRPTCACRRRSACPTSPSPTCSGVAVVAAAAGAVRQRLGGAGGRLREVRRRLPRPGAGHSSGASARTARRARFPIRAAYTAPYGLMSPAQTFRHAVRRFMHDHHVEQEALTGDLTGLVSPRAGKPARRDVRPAAQPLRTTTTRAGSWSRSTCSTAAWRTTAPPRSC